MKEIKVNYNANSIFDIDVTFFKKIGIKTVICDLDNTLDQYNVLRPSSKVIQLKETLKEQDIDLMIVSNNSEQRVKNYSLILGVKYLFKASKPFPKKFLKFISENNLIKDEIIFVGDQLLTDMKLARKANVKSILTEPLYKKEQFRTRFNRIIDKLLRKKYKKDNRLGVKCPEIKRIDNIE